MEKGISQKFGVVSLLRFALPSTVMMMIISVYTIVDGIFVSNFVGDNAFTALNIVFPFCTVVIAIGTMFSTGSNAIISKKLGEGNVKGARESFSFLTSVAVVAGIILLLVGTVFTENIARALGATDNIINNAKIYLFIVSLFAPAFVIQILAQIMFVTAGKPHFGLIITIAGGLANIVFDWLFIVVLNMGIAGAAIGTGLGNVIPAIVFLAFFSRKNCMIRFIRFKFNGHELLKTVTNGSSELVSNLANSITAFIFNLMVLRIAGENGVATLGILMYSQFLMISVFLGYSQGVSPVISYKYGAGDEKQLKKIFKISIISVIVGSVFVFVFSIAAKDMIILIFTDRGSNIFNIARKGFPLFSIAYLFMGINLFSSSLFTALSNGKISAFISFLRTFVFILIAIFTMPYIFGINGVWLAIPVAEFITIFVSCLILIKYRKVYKY